MSKDAVETIKNAITCRMFVERIGLSVNRAGYCCCPFHGEKTPSLKIYSDGKGWYCFGCHVGGDVINMAKLYYNTSFRDAVKRLSDEFGIQFRDNGSQDVQDAILMAVKRAKDKSIAEKKRRFRETLEAEYWIWFDKWLENERIIEKFAPKSPDEDFDKRYVQAVIHREELRDSLEDAEVRRNMFNGC